MSDFDLRRPANAADVFAIDRVIEEIRAIVRPLDPRVAGLALGACLWRTAFETVERSGLIDEADVDKASAAIVATTIKSGLRYDLVDRAERAKRGEPI